jgi:glycosyltransferase involved in cell wall biosynthesis
MQPALEATGATHVTLGIGRKSPFTFRHARALRRLFAAEGVDIVHARSRLPAWLAWLALRGMPADARPRFATTVHGLNSPSRYSGIMARGERVVCVSGTVRAHVLRHYPGTDPSRLRVIERGIDPAAFPRAPRPDRDARAAVAARHAALGGEGPLLLLPGRGTRLKGHADAIELLAAVRGNGSASDARLWLCGADDPSRRGYVAELRARAEALGVADAVAITPPTDAMPRAYAASDLVLQLSRKPEAFGRTVLEALSSGRPVAGWAHGGVGELLARWQPSGAVEPFDGAALAARAWSLLAAPPPAVTIPDGLVAMQEATLAMYMELMDDPDARTPT